jgi:hypothetical protein
MAGLLQEIEDTRREEQERRLRLQERD